MDMEKNCLSKNLEYTSRTVSTTMLMLLFLTPIFTKSSFAASGDLWLRADMLWNACNTQFDVAQIMYPAYSLSNYVC